MALRLARPARPSHPCQRPTAHRLAAALAPSQRPFPAAQPLSTPPPRPAETAGSRRPPLTEAVVKAAPLPARDGEAARRQVARFLEAPPPAARHRAAPAAVVLPAPAGEVARHQAARSQEPLAPAAGDPAALATPTAQADMEAPAPLLMHLSILPRRTVHLAGTGFEVE